MAAVSGQIGEIENETAAPAEFVASVERSKQARMFDELLGEYLRASLSDIARPHITVEEAVDAVKKNVNPRLIAALWKYRQPDGGS